MSKLQIVTAIVAAFGLCQSRSLWWAMLVMLAAFIAGYSYGVEATK